MKSRLIIIWSVVFALEAMVGLNEWLTYLHLKNISAEQTGHFETQDGIHSHFVENTDGKNVRCDLQIPECFIVVREGNDEYLTKIKQIISTEAAQELAYQKKCYAELHEVKPNICADSSNQAFDECGGPPPCSSDHSLKVIRLPYKILYPDKLKTEEGRRDLAYGRQLIGSSMQLTKDVDLLEEGIKQSRKQAADLLEQAKYLGVVP